MREIPIEINGALWVNCSKYENVDKIIIDHNEVNIYNKGEFIGSILRKNIKTLVEQNYEKGISTDLIDNLIYSFDITKEGDFGEMNNDTIQFLEKIMNIDDGYLMWDSGTLTYWDYGEEDEEKNEYGASLKTNIVDAYIIYKTKRDGLDFDYVATDDELKQLGQYFIDNADKEHKLSFEDIYEIDRKMAIVGCRNFITNQDLRSIVASSIETSDKVGITYGFYQTLYNIIRKRSNDIPQALVPLDCKPIYIDTVNHFIAKLNQITEQENKKGDYIVHDGKIYRYIGDV